MSDDIWSREMKELENKLRLFSDEKNVDMDINLNKREVALIITLIDIYYYPDKAG